jgi:hypothetical protein
VRNPKGKGRAVTNKDFRRNFLPATKLLRKTLDTINEIGVGCSRGLAEKEPGRRSFHFSFLGDSDAAFAQ